jgi:hypothetical protein
MSQVAGLITLIIVLIIVIVLCIVLSSKKKKDIIYVFWTGDNPMSDNRKNCLKNLEKVSECKVVLINNKNLHLYILENYPLHPAYKFLSATHKADYLRTYFMNFYGGGYSDIKNTTGSWKKAFEEMINNPDAYINGYPELESMNLMEGLIGNCAYIAKPNTELTNQWYNNLLKKLDEKLIHLQQINNTSSVAPQESKSEFYPIEWEEILRQIFHPLLEKYINSNRILYSVPKPKFDNYR